MADFEDNNPFAGGDHISNDFTNLSINSPPSTEGDHDDSSSIAHKDSQGRKPSRTYSSRVEQILMSPQGAHISIIEASKSHEGNSRGFIAYTIKIGDVTVRRRYSEFESLRTTLTKLFPTLIVPPIPEKHTMSDYAASPTRAKEDVGIIEHRQRMLAVFLNRCNAMPQIKESSVFQRFLDPNSSWSEVLNSSPVSNLPKNILKAPPLDPSQPSIAHSYLPLPSSSAKLKSDSDATFDEAEQKAKEYEHVIAGGLEKVNRRIIKRHSDMAADYSELGARFNAFSLEENGPLASAIEKVGQAIDNNYLTTEVLVSALSSSFSESLGESAQFAAVVRSVLKYRRQKALQLELTAESLASKSASLETLERSEQEAQRINQFLKRDFGDIAPPFQQDKTGSETLSNTSQNLQQQELSLNQQEQDHDSHSDIPNEESFPPTHADASPRQKKSSFKFPGIGKLNHAIHGIMDVDPEATRRSNIGKTREQISQLEEALKVAKSDLTEASDSVKHDLERFQATKEKDLRFIMQQYIRSHIEWAHKNLENWQDAKAEVEKL